jgi:feruloyl esterase
MHSSTFSRRSGLCAKACLTLGSAVLLSLWTAPGAAQTPAQLCQSLTALKIPAASIGLPTSGATLSSAELIAADAPKNNNGEFCKVLGAIHPVDPKAPDINF